MTMHIVDEYADYGYDEWDTELCPACGDEIDYCTGHGELTDPEGMRVVRAHNDGDHSDCLPEACEDAICAALTYISYENPPEYCERRVESYDTACWEHS